MSDKPSDWAGAHARQQAAAMPERAAAATRLIESAVRLRLLINGRDAQTKAAVLKVKTAWPALWAQVEEVANAMSGYGSDGTTVN